MHAELQIVAPVKGEKYMLMPGEYIILGRGDTADIMLKEDASLSRLHCKIFYKNKNFWIEDLGSRNRSFVNQQPVTSQILKNKDKIAIGRYRILFTLVEDSFVSVREPFNALKNSDKLSGRIAVQLNLITKEKLNACVKIQEEMVANGPYYPLSEILEQEGLLSKKNLEQIENFKKQIPFRIPNYKLQELIGMGGMGRIYLARCLKTGLLRACKIFCDMPEEFQKQIQEQFQREADALLQFHHINIVKGIEKGNTEKAIYLIMEYIDGTTLKGYLKERGDRLLPDEALKIVIQIARALEHANSFGMVHRDIKPENVMIDKKGVVKLCDFGLVKNTNVESQEEGVFGTVAYMSPEQIRLSKNIDIRSDIYSLGVLFYRILFGKLPFSGDTETICQQHLHSKLAFPQERQPSKKMELSKILLKMMEKKPDARYPSPKELLYDLEIAKTMFFDENIDRTEEVPYAQRNFSNTTRIYMPRFSGLKKIKILCSILLLFFAVLGIGFLSQQYSINQEMKEISFFLEEKNYEKAEKSIYSFLKKNPGAKESKKLKEDLQALLLSRAKESSENFYKACSLYQEIIELDSESDCGKQAKDFLSELQKKEKEKRQIEEFYTDLATWDAFFLEGNWKEARKFLISLEAKAKTKEAIHDLQKRKEMLQKEELKIELASCRYYEAKDIPSSITASLTKKILSFMPGREKPVLEKPFPVKGYFFLPFAGYLHCLKAQDGSLPWSFYYGESERISWILLSGEKEVLESIQADRILVSGIGNDCIKMFSLRTGSLLWETKLPHSISAEPLWTEGSILAVCQDQCYRIDSRGKILGYFLTKTSIQQKPALDSKKSLLYLKGEKGVYVFHTIQGNLHDYLSDFPSFLKTQQTLPESIPIESQNPQIFWEEQRILVFDKVPKIYDTKTWQSLWIHKDDKKEFPGIACTSWQKNGHAYFIGTKIGKNSWGHAFSFEASKKALLWQRRIGSGFSQEPVITKKNFLWLSRDDGSLFQMGGKSSIPRYRMTKGHPYEDVTSYLLYLPEKDLLVVVRNKGVSRMVHASQNSIVQDWNFRESWTICAPGLSQREEESFFFAPEKSLCAFSLISGRKISKDYRAEYRFTTPIHYLKGSIFLGDEAGNFYRFQIIRTKEEMEFQKIWVKKYSHPLYSMPVSYPDGLCFGCDKGIFYNIHPSTGNTQWQFQADASIKSKPLVYENTIYFGNDSGAFYALKAKTGEILWQKKLEGAISAAPIIKNRKLYVSTQKGFLYALSFHSGIELWSTKLEGAMKNSFFFWNNTLYAASDNDFIYIVEEN